MQKANTKSCRRRSMFLFFETIKIKNSKIYNLKYHNHRVNRTISEVFSKKSNLNLKEYIKLPKDETLYKCKLTYSTKIENITLEPYKMKRFKNFICIESDIQYPYKSVNREEFEKLTELNKEYDEIIIIKDNLLTDTTIANIALYNGLKWFTPKTPLLEGTLRASLIEQKLLKTKDLDKKALKSCVKIAIMNAIIGFYELKDIKIRY